MKDRRIPIIIAGFALFMLGIVVSNFMSDTVDSKQISQLISEQLTKLSSNNQGMRGYSELSEKLSALETKIAILHHSGKVKNNTTTESSQILALLEKISELEKKINTLNMNQSVNNSNEQKLIPVITRQDLLAETKAAESAINAHYQTLEDSFQSEQADPQWSLTMNDKIKNSIEKLNQDGSSDGATSVIAMDCKTTLCRVELSYDGNGDMGILELNLLQSLGDEIGESSSKPVNDSDGKVSSMVYYFARQGHSVVRSQQNP